MVASGTALANENAPDNNLVESSVLLAGEQKRPLLGHFNFCKEYPTKCHDNTNLGKPFKMTSVQEEKMYAVNFTVNHEVTPMTDMMLYGEEDVWKQLDVGALNLESGDCEEYVIAKASMLINAGFPPSALSIVRVLQADGEGHAVLAVNTHKGTKILDNMRDEIRFPHETGYRFDRMQLSYGSIYWVNAQVLSNTGLRLSLNQ